MEHALGMNGETGRSKVAFFDSKPLWQSNNSIVSICFILQPHFCRSLQCFGAQGAILSYWRSSKLGKAKHAKSVNKAKFFATVQSPFVQGQPGSMWHWLAFDVLGHYRSKPPLHIDSSLGFGFAGEKEDQCGQCEPFSLLNVAEGVVSTFQHIVSLASRGHFECVPMRAVRSVIELGKHRK